MLKREIHLLKFTIISAVIIVMLDDNEIHFSLCRIIGHNGAILSPMLRTYLLK